MQEQERIMPTPMPVQAMPIPPSIPIPIKPQNIALKRWLLFLSLFFIIISPIGSILSLNVQGCAELDCVVLVLAIPTLLAFYLVLLIAWTILYVNYRKGYFNRIVWTIFMVIIAICFVSTAQSLISVYQKIGFSFTPQSAPGYNSPDRTTETYTEIVKQQPDISGMYGYSSSLFQYNNKEYIFSWHNVCSISTFVQVGGDLSKCDPRGKFQSAQITLGVFDQMESSSTPDISSYRDLITFPPLVTFDDFSESPGISRLGTGYRFSSGSNSEYVGDLDGNANYIISNPSRSIQYMQIYKDKLYALEGQNVAEYDTQNLKGRIVSQLHSPYCNIFGIFVTGTGLYQIEVPNGGEGSVQASSKCFNYLIDTNNTSVNYGLPMDLGVSINTATSSSLAVPVPTSINAPVITPLKSQSSVTMSAQLNFNVIQDPPTVYQKGSTNQLLLHFTANVTGSSPVNLYSLSLGYIEPTLATDFNSFTVWQNGKQICNAPLVKTSEALSQCTIVIHPNTNEDIEFRGNVSTSDLGNPTDSHYFMIGSWSTDNGITSPIGIFREPDFTKQ